MGLFETRIPCLYTFNVLSLFFIKKCVFSSPSSKANFFAHAWKNKLWTIKNFESQKSLIVSEAGCLERQKLLNVKNELLVKSVFNVLMYSVFFFTLIKSQLFWTRVFLLENISHCKTLYVTFPWGPIILFITIVFLKNVFFFYCSLNVRATSLMYVTISFFNKTICVADIFSCVCEWTSSR